MKIVIISLNSYPTLGPRAHRTTELAKELARRGHNVILYVLKGDYDYSAFESNTNITIKNLGKSICGLSDNTGYNNYNLLTRTARKLFRVILEFPNIELIPLVKRALKKEGDIDYLITIAHPHTIHWSTAQYVSKNKGKVKFWVADCGDPFMGNPFDKHPFYFKYNEKKWNRLCNYITVPVEEAIAAYYPEFRNKIRVIPQGFDFSNTNLSEYKPNKVPTFAYSGIVYKDLRDPTLFLDYLCTIKTEFRFIVYTKTKSFFEQYKSKLNDKLEILDYVPRDQLIYELSKMDFLINIKNQSGVQQPSKLIDYYLTERPILEISSLFNERNIFEEFIRSDFNRQKMIPGIDEYNIINVTDKFINLYKI